MNILDRLERGRIDCPQKQWDVHEDDDATALERGLMLEEYSRTATEYPALFADIRRKENAWYLVIYLWNTSYGNKGYKYYRVSYGHRLEKREEEELLSCCMAENTGFSEYNIREVVKTVQAEAPEMNVCFYNKNPLHSVLHIYFCMFRGLRELLFKARLPYLAADIYSAEDVNLLAGSPGELFEEKVTMKMLRLLNTDWGVKELEQKAGRKLAIQTYRKFACYLGGYGEVTQSQWEYLKDCFRGHFSFSRKTFRFFGGDDKDALYEDYVIYQAKAAVINQYTSWKKPLKVNMDLYRYMDQADLWLEYLMYKPKWDLKMLRQSERLSYLDYQDERYTVLHPETVEDIFAEAQAQGNCLMGMYRDIAEAKRDVGFMRRTGAVERSFITFEVLNGKVCQLRARQNKNVSPESEEYQWFQQVYVKNKGLSMEMPVRNCGRLEPDYLRRNRLLIDTLHRAGRGAVHV